MKECRRGEKRAHGVCLHTGAVLTFVSELWKLESRSLTGALKRGRIGCRGDRRVTRIHNTGRGLARCDPVPLTHLYRRINMQGEAEAQQQMAANPPWWLKEGWNPGISSLTPGVAQISDSHKPRLLLYKVDVVSAPFLIQLWHSKHSHTDKKVLHSVLIAFSIHFFLVMIKSWV